METGLFKRIEEELEVKKLDDEVSDILKAACLDCLDAVLEGESFATVIPAGGVAELGVASRAMLSWIEVEGFRGVARGDRLEIKSGPGLTLVVGRNGSGKSSYVEGLETAMRGTSVRWEGRQMNEWTRGWANLHHPSDKAVKVKVGFLVSGKGELVLERRWASGEADVDHGVADFSDSSTLEGRGWTNAMKTTPPILSYSEIGRLADQKHVDLHGKLAILLGLEEVGAAIERLNDAKNRREVDHKRVKKLTVEILSLLKGHADPRAKLCIAALKKRGGWDIGAIEDVALQEDEGSDLPGLATLKRVASMRGPDPTAGKEVCAQLREVAGHIEDLEGTAMARHDKLAGLLEKALDAVGPDDRDCPVCGTGDVLDQKWRERTTEALGESRRAASALREVESRRKQAVRAAQRLLERKPPLDLALLAEAGIADRGIKDAWSDWNAGAMETDLLSLADQIEGQLHALSSLCEEVRQDAAGRIAGIEDAWRPIKRRLSAWCDEAPKAVEMYARARKIEKARKWLVEAEKTLRCERFEPIKARATDVWAMLRQDSSVELKDISLVGAGNHRKVELTASVNDVEASALSVMSQGELNALALALFLPRALNDASPFGFVVIDDPVQSMDPHKIDGLATVLAKVAKDRQVVVFTHDPRLVEATRRMKIPATVLEVVRQASSQVQIHRATDPVDQYLRDATSVLYSAEKLGEKVVGGLVSFQCRAAVEAASMEVVRRRKLSQSVSHKDVELELQKIKKVHDLVTLAVLGDVKYGAELYKRLNNWNARFADVFKALKEGSHGSSNYSGTWREMVERTRALTEKIRGCK